VDRAAAGAASRCRPSIPRASHRYDVAGIRPLAERALIWQQETQVTLGESPTNQGSRPKTQPLPKASKPAMQDVRIRAAPAGLGPHGAHPSGGALCTLGRPRRRRRPHRGHSLRRNNCLGPDRHPPVLNTWAHRMRDSQHQTGTGAVRQPGGRAACPTRQAQRGVQ